MVLAHIECQLSPIAFIVTREVLCKSSACSLHPGRVVIPIVLPTVDSILQCLPNGRVGGQVTKHGRIPYSEVVLVTKCHAP